jgi:hypothetical protein
VRKRRRTLFRNSTYEKRAFCQDTLGTSIRKTQKGKTVSSGVGAHGTSIVTFVLMIDMKAPGGSDVPYAWEHWLRNFLDLRDACADHEGA